MSAEDGSWMPVDLLPTRLWHFWSSPPAIGWPWSYRLPGETCFVRRAFICIRRPFKLELTSCSPFDNSLSLSSFRRHLKTFLFIAHAARLFGVLFTKTRYINSLLLLFPIVTCIDWIVVKLSCQHTVLDVLQSSGPKNPFLCPWGRRVAVSCGRVVRVGRTNASCGSFAH